MTHTPSAEMLADDLLAQIEDLIEAGVDDCLTSKEIIGNVTVALGIPRLAASLNYKEAIDTELVMCHLGIAKDNPRAELNQIINWHVMVALDPRVSEKARQLVASSPDYAQGMRVGLERAALLVERETTAVNSRHIRGFEELANNVASMLADRDFEIAANIRALPVPDGREEIQPVKKFEDTFSAESVVMDTFFPSEANATGDEPNKLTDCMNVMLLIENGCDENFARRIVDQWNAKCRAPNSAGAEPVAWRWQEKDWKDYWVYNPDPAWLAEQNNIVKQPLYATPPAIDRETIARISDKELWDNSCITRVQLASWTDADFESHAVGVRTTIKFLIDRLDALSLNTGAKT